MGRRRRRRRRGEEEVEEEGYGPLLLFRGDASPCLLTSRPSSRERLSPDAAVLNASDGVARLRHRVLFVVRRWSAVLTSTTTTTTITTITMITMITTTTMTTTTTPRRLPNRPLPSPFCPAPLPRGAVLFASLRSDPRIPENPRAPLRGRRRCTSACVRDAEGYNTASRPAREREEGNKGRSRRPRENGGGTGSGSAMYGGARLAFVRLTSRVCCPVLAARV